MEARESLCMRMADFCFILSVQHISNLAALARSIDGLIAALVLYKTGENVVHRERSQGTRARFRNRYIYWQTASSVRVVRKRSWTHTADTPRLSCFFASVRSFSGCPSRLVYGCECLA